MKNQALFSSKDKSKKSKCRRLQFLFDALSINQWHSYNFKRINHSMDPLHPLQTDGVEIFLEFLSHQSYSLQSEVVPPR